MTNRERLYEGMFLLDAREARREGSDIEDRVKALLAKHGARIEHVGRWEERKLAYEIRGHKRAVYFLAFFRLATTALAELRREAQLQEGILRVLFLQVDAVPAEDLFHPREAVAAGGVEGVAVPAAALAVDAGGGGRERT